MKKLDIAELESEIKSKKAELAKLNAEYDKIVSTHNPHSAIASYSSPFNHSSFDAHTALNNYFSSRDYVTSSIKKDILKLQKQIDKLEEKLAELQPTT